MYSSSRLYSPAAERNQSYIVEVIQKYHQMSLQAQSSSNHKVTLLEIASGSGQHASALAQNIPHLKIQPSDCHDEHLKSIDQYRFELEERNQPHSLEQAQYLDVTQDIKTWPLINQMPYHLMLCVNMIHISPWTCTEALFKGAHTHLIYQGYLITYGPYEFPPQVLAESNQAFHQSLQNRNPQWGIRSVDSLDQSAQSFGLKRIHTYSCPANNHILVYQKLKEGF